MSEHLQRTDVDTVIFWLETSPRRIRERKLTRQLRIPGRVLQSHGIDLARPPWSEKIEKMLEKDRALEKTKGRIYNVYCPGAPLEHITSLIYSYGKLAASRQRPLVVLIDYLQVIDRKSGKTDYEGLSYNATRLKDVAGQNNCHIILFSQESTDVIAKSKGDSKSYGTTVPIQRAQIHIAIERIRADKTYFVEENGQIRKDAVGGDRIWQYANRRGSVFRLNILRANDYEPGVAYGMIENPLFRIHDISALVSAQQRDKLPLWVWQDIERFELADQKKRHAAQDA